MDRWETQALDARIRARTSPDRPISNAGSALSEPTSERLEEIRIELAGVAALLVALNRQFETITRLLALALLLLAVIALKDWL